MDILHLGYFNTSNVTIQPKIFRYSPKFNSISIHLMLLFNHLPGNLPSCHLDFNTSNVTIQLLLKFIASEFSISIHLMLLFNFLLCQFFFVFHCISIHLMLLFNPFSLTSLISLAYFNTSNVTIQHTLRMTSLIRK